MTEQSFRNPRNGMNIGYVSRGEGQLVVFVHGFPDTYRGFLPVLDLVAGAGYRAVAMALRGYAPSDLARDGDYRVEASAQDVIDLADGLGAEQFSVVGHDWGAVTGYAAANLAPQRVRRLITAAVPHTGHFLLSMGPRQIKRSLYMLGFQVPVLPEAKIVNNDFAWLESLIHGWSPAWRFGEKEMRPLKQNYLEPGRLKAALSWYRQLPRSIASPLSRRLIFSAVSVPTRIIYGVQDGCIGPEMFAGQEKRFSNGLDLVPLSDAGHFMQWEQPEKFAQLVIDFLEPPAGKS
ncbi:alpha/beta fold hydrolase [Duganella aceris]|uniref:Alpha/beta hydrolase n=1 Tax=Duganella aceris TaxID=2703883 RepID=A0ABX0FGN2_9BURK|nr:alpha/beta hydrolase [Duganella aceris]NGZ83740.1 alpha/beta hydrolase [Duganella aceris]